MLRKTLTQLTILVLFVLVLYGTTGNAQAGGVCGGTYIVEQGDTVDSIAAKCGTQAAAIYAANPGLTGSLSAGQAITVPGSTYSVPTGTSIPVTPTTTNTGASDAYYNYYSYYAYHLAAGSLGSYNGTYSVQAGDTFSVIANKLGVNEYDLWAANPQIWDINFLYPGQLVYVPINNGQLTNPTTATTTTTTTTTTVVIAPTPTDPAQLSYGTVPYGAPKGKIVLSNKSHSEVYVSLQIKSNDGVDFIDEYTVKGTFTVKEPAGWVSYVASVGGRMFTGEFRLQEDPNRGMTFYSNRVEIK